MYGCAARQTGLCLGCGAALQSVHEVLLSVPLCMACCAHGEAQLWHCTWQACEAPLPSMLLGYLVCRPGCASAPPKSW